MIESDLLRAVLELCQYRGCLVHHCRPARKADGAWSTPIAGDAGFPDLVIVGPRGVLFRELKATLGQLSGAQRTWIARLTRAGADVAVWRPDDLTSGRIVRELGALQADGLGLIGPRGHDQPNLEALCHPHRSQTTAVEQPGAACSQGDAK